MSEVRFNVLGPFEVVVDATLVDPGTTMERALLARLLLQPGTTVSIDRLVDDLWTGSAPTRPSASLRVYVSRLRKKLGAGTIETLNGGYRVVVDDEAIDAARFQRMTARGREALLAGDFADASRTLREGLDLWRGEAWDELVSFGWARADATRLNESRLTALEARIEADLALGRQDILEEELAGLTRAHPMRESLWALRIRALYAAGRQADALAAYRTLRDLLSEELGIDPSPDLQRLEAAVLNQSDELSRLSGPHEPTLPSGVVTFLMTDVVGSTALWEADPATMDRAMRTHDTLIEQAVSRAGGLVVKPRGEGDSRFCVFTRATDALTAAAEIQRATRTVDWPTRDPIELRIAVYTGEASPRDGDYYGTSPNRCARLRDVGAGGQVVVAETTARLVDLDGSAGDLTLEPLGSFRLRDVRTPEAVFQLAGPGLPTTFPPLTASSTVGNIPEARTSLVGRTQDVAELLDRLTSDRMITLTGAAGCGKTRLGLEVAHQAAPRYPDGAWFIELAPIAKASEVAATIMRTLDLPARPGASAEDTVVAGLAGKRCLLLLDNCEHVIDDAAAIVDRLLAETPDVTALATSREPLGVHGEVTWRVPSLRLPAGAEDADERSPAVELFIQRAQQSDPAFDPAPHLDAIASICRQLDGIPLAIELAAAKVGMLAPDEIADRLDDHLEILTGGPRSSLERHQTIRAAIGWSYGLLSDQEREVLNALSVFAGTFTLDQAERVCTGPDLPPQTVFDVIESLIAKSLIAKDPSSKRFSLLQIVRAYAAEALDASRETQRRRARHFAVYVELARQVRDDLRFGPRTIEVMRDLAHAHDDLVAAIRFGLRYDPKATVEAAQALNVYFEATGQRSFVVEAMDDAVERLDEADIEARVAAKILSANFRMNAGIGFERARVDLEEAIASSRAHGWSMDLARALMLLGWLHQLLGRGDLTDDLLAEAREIAVREGDEIMQANIDGRVAYISQTPQARESLVESIRTARRLGAAHVTRTHLGYLAAFDLKRGDLDGAERAARDQLVVSMETGNQIGVAGANDVLAGVAASRGQAEKARPIYLSALEAVNHIGQPGAAAILCVSLGEVALDLDDLEEARAWRAEAERHLSVVGASVHDLLVQLLEGQIAAQEGDLTRARTLLEVPTNDPPIRASAAISVAGVELQAGDLRAAAEALRRALALADEAGLDGQRAAALVRTGRAVLEHDAETAATLLYVAERYADQGSMRARTRREMQDAIARCREVLAEERLTHARERARTQRLAEACAIADAACADLLGVPAGERSPG